MAVGRWKYLALLFLLVMSLLAAGCGDLGGTKYAVIIKTVDELGNRLPNVSILYKKSGEQVSAKTDSEGLVELDQLQGEVTVSAVKDDWGFAPAEIKVTSADQGDKLEFTGTQKATSITIGSPLFKKVKSENSLHYYDWKLNLANAGMSGKAIVTAEYTLKGGSTEKSMLTAEPVTVPTLQKELALSGTKALKYELSTVKLTLEVLDSEGNWVASPAIDAQVQ